MEFCCTDWLSSSSNASVSMRMGDDASLGVAVVTVFVVEANESVEFISISESNDRGCRVVVGVLVVVLSEGLSVAQQDPYDWVVCD